uniref:VWFA domain-containing protein n=1 Tax=Magallana gigas TaxID=29159 RepID=A0A8W8IDT0_MAGGI|nr:uncharacterized protein LOC105343823 isoform X1 [Crassostrea gigas]XP_034325150.1 uncharacterized protein LOC105343823 isoform X1 [Crassostrea gigas]XP_034325151.1 uncharacterized protein LOC105343823 isoform X1 [Crassostrea gigas]
MNNEPNSVHIKAQKGSVISGKSTVVGDLPHGTQKPEITSSGFNRILHPPGSVRIDASDANISVADDMAVLFIIQRPKGEVHLPADNSSLPSPLSVTESDSSGEAKLHLVVHKEGSYIQIGQCCVIVEMHVTDQTLERLKAQGTLEIESQIGASLVTMRWRGLELDEAKLRTNIKVKLTKRLLDLERKVLQDLMANQCDKCQQLVIFLMKEFRGYLTEVSLGCIQLTLFFSNIEDLQRGRSPDSISKIQKFLDKLLLTKTIRPISGSVRFSLTLPEQEGFTNKNDTIVYNRGIENTSAETPSISEYERTSIGDQSGVITVDEFTRQILQIKDFLKNEVASLRNVISEETQGIEKRILDHISKKQDRNVRSSMELESQNVPKRNSHLGIDRSDRDSGFVPGITPSHSSMSLTDDGGAAQLDITNVERNEKGVRENKGSARQETPGIQEKQHAKDTGNKWQAANVVDETQYDEESDQVDGDFVDFSQLFDAILGKRSESGPKIFEEHHETLKEIWGEDLLNVVQQALAKAVQVTRELNDDEELDEFCTVLCLDVSHSMAGEPFEEQRAEAKKIIKACLGNIGLVSIGSETKVEQELTKDKTRALKVMDQLKINHLHPVSSSPVIQGLFTVLQLLNGTVRPTTYGSHHTRYPKIVIISDGFFNDCSPDSERKQQQCKKTNELLVSVLEVLVAMSIRVPIYFVPVGKKMEMSPKSINILSETHEWFNKLSVVDNVELLFDSKKRETAMGRVMTAIMSPNQPETPYKSWMTIKEELYENHTGKEMRHIEWLITESFKRPPPVGTRVRVAGLQPQTTGTILCRIEELNRKLTEKVLVVRDTGETDVFSWSFNQKDLLFYEPSKSSDSSEFTVGSLIREGGHRIRGDLGVVIENEHAASQNVPKTSWPRDAVKVCWRSKLTKGNGCLFHRKSMIKHVESPLIDLKGLIASRTLAWHFAK